jgi:hypothetical protein
MFNCFLGHIGEWVDAELVRTFTPGLFNQSLGVQQTYVRGQKRRCIRCGKLEIRQV